MPAKDLVFGAIVLAILPKCVYAAGRVFSRVKNARFARAWRPLVPVIVGTVAATAEARPTVG